MSARRAIVVVALFALVLLGKPSGSERACTISTTSVVFGTYNVFSATPVMSTGSVTYRCGFFEWLFSTVVITLDTARAVRTPQGR